MPVSEILLALLVLALAADSVTVIAALAQLVCAAKRRWREHTRE